jgi:hypothetical protein
MTMQCPFCESHQIQRHAVVHSAGTHNIQVDHIGTVNGQFAKSYSHGTQYSALAQRCAPPSMDDLHKIFTAVLAAFVLGGFAVVGAIATLPHINWQWLLGGLAGMGVGWLLFKLWRHEAKAIHTAKLQWQNTWFCHGCGQSHTRS